MTTMWGYYSCPLYKFANVHLLFMLTYSLAPERIDSQRESQFMSHDWIIGT